MGDMIVIVKEELVNGSMIVIVNEELCEWVI